MIITSPYTLSASFQYDQCWFDWTPLQYIVFSIIILSFTNVLPTVILCWAYLKSVHIFRRSAIEAQTNLGIGRDRQFQRIKRLFSLITLTFVLFTTPFTCLYSVYAYYGYTNVHHESNEYLYHALYLLSCCNFVINPFFYAFDIKILCCFTTTSN